MSSRPPRPSTCSSRFRFVIARSRCTMEVTHAERAGAATSRPVYPLSYKAARRGIERQPCGTLAVTSIHTVRWRTVLADSTSSGALAGIEGLLARAGADLAELRLRRGREAGPPPDPADPADPVRCLEIWLAALRAVRALPLRVNANARPPPPKGRGRRAERPDRHRPDGPARARRGGRVPRGAR